jgi:Carboxypeptidase regulatory-like domain
MRLSKISMRATGFAVCAVFLAAAAHAQYRASIQGVVTDPQGTVVSGATVTLTNHETNQTLTTTTNDNGIYNFNGLPPSQYSITAEKQGFKKKVLDNLNVIAEQANAVNIQLEVGQVTESVTVNGDSTPLIDTETSNLSGTVNAKEFQALPSIGRDPFQLLQLAPGAFGDGAQAAGGGTNNLPSTTIGGTGGTDGVFKIENGGQISANGARTAENNYQIDGVGTTSVTWGGTSVVTPNEDAIKEVKIITDNYDAENGRYRGAQVQIITQNGTNQYHGSFFFKAHRPGLNAYTKYNGYPGSCCGGGANVRDNFRFNDWGGTAGGPILKNKLFIFFGYERLDNNAASATQSGWYTTSQFATLAPSGSNAEKFLAFSGAGPNGGTQVDQTCLQAGLTEGTNCHMIPGQGLNLGSPLSAPLGTRDAGYTGSSSPGTGGNGSGGANNLGTTPDIAFYTGILNPSTSSHVQYNGRLDFNVTSKDLVAFSLYHVPNTSTSINGNGIRLMNTFNSAYLNHAETLLWDHTFSPNLLNEVRINAAGWMNKDLGNNPNAPWGLPQVSFNGTGSILVNGFGIGSFNGFDQWTYAGKDVLTKVHGAHTMKMGGEFTRLLSVDAPFWADRPGYTFNNIWDFLNDAPVVESAQSDPKTGVPSALRKDVRDNLVGLFYQDNYKLRPNVTITAGLRWDYYGPITAKNGLLATVVFGSGSNEFTNLRVRTGGSQYNAQKGNFGPQLGFAWSPKQLLGHEFGSRLVFRGGVGIAYQGLTQSNSLDTRFNPPFVDNSPNFACPPTVLDTTKCTLLYISSFPSNIHNPNGYAANPNAILTFGSNNLPLASCLTPTTTSGCISLVALPANFPTEYTYHYTLDTEYDLGRQWVASIGYQGSNTRHLLEHYNLYDAVSASAIAFNPLVGGITYYADDGSARFNALLLELKHAFSQSFSLDAQYRLSHGMDSVSNAYSSGYYPWNLATGFATSDYDVRHAFKMFGVWSPTIFRGSQSWMEKVVGGWSLSGILNAHSGFPWTPLYNFQGASDFGVGDPVFNFGGAGAGGSSSNSGNQAGMYMPAAYKGGFAPNFGSSAATTGGGSALFTPPNVSGGVLFPCLFPNPPASLCPSGQQPLGPLPTKPGIARNSFRGPGYFDIDATLSKSFGLPNMKLIGENGRIEFRANFYNLFNRLNLNGNGQQYSGGIQAEITNSHFGESQSALGARVIELQARFSF